MQFAGDPDPLLLGLRTLTHVCAAVGVATVAIPPLRRWLYGDKEQIRRSHAHPLAAIDDRGQLLHPSGRRTLVYRLDGIDPSLSSADLREAQEASIASLYVSLGAYGPDIRWQRHKRRLPPIPAPTPPVLSSVARYNHDKSSPFYELNDYLFITPPIVSEGTIETINGIVLSVLSNLHPVRLTAASGATDPLADILSPSGRDRMAPVRLPTQPLAPVLMGDEITYDEGAGLLELRRPGGAPVYVTVYQIVSIGDQATPALSREIMMLPFWMVEQHAVRPQPRPAAISVLKRAQRYAREAGSKTLDSKIDKAVDEQVGGDRANTVTVHGWTLAVFATTKEEADSADEQIARIAASYNFGLRREGQFLEIAYKALIPGNHLLTATPRTLDAHQIAHMTPILRTDTGVARSEWLPDRPVARYVTTIGGLYNFSFHATGEDNRPTPHTALFGLPGTGKTAQATWWELLLLQSPDAVIIHVDNKRAAYPAARALGDQARYFVLGDDPAFNFCQLPDTPENRDHLRDMLTLMIGRGKELPLTTRRQIEDAVKINYSVHTPVPLRNLRYLVDAFPPATQAISEEDSFAHSALQEWVVGTGASLFTADSCSLRLDGARAFFFDFDKVADDPLKSALVMRDLGHRVTQFLLREKRPLLLVVDETSRYCAVPGMAQWLERLMDLIRRLGGGVLTMWQRPKQVADVGMLSVIKQQAQTKVALADSEISEEEYQQLLEFTPQETAVLKLRVRLPGLRRVGLIKKGSRSTVVEMHLDLGAGQPFLSGSKGAAKLEQLEAQDASTAISKFMPGVSE